MEKQPSERQQEVLDYLEMGYVLTCNVSGGNTLFDAALEGAGSRQTVSIPTLRSLLRKSWLVEKHRMPLSGEWQVVTFAKKHLIPRTIPISHQVSLASLRSQFQRMPVRKSKKSRIPQYN